ncbi:TlpA disulfide reductase family protein [Modestobacter sp. Leaf380]|uniref:TlpA family protein disulfide reductase n=1 Tax=Modestobacter sp. Leaf380 TaxID=1736356 RepID=UPI0006FAE87E|nr:TlpA disulfide reductase family protein [Modestobacter sp. Leaf380]KQS68702.1 redoxin [Modestobacter sp. Leaf380]
MRRALAVAGAALVLLSGCTGAGSSDDGGGRVAEPAVDDVQGLDTALQSCPEQSGEPVEAADALPPMSFDCIGGGTLDLSLAPGVPTVVNVWGSWCPPCRDELPVVQQLADAGGDQLQVLGLVSQDTLTAADSFAADAGVTFPNAFDQQGDLMAELGRNGAPYTFFLAADGTLAHTEAGQVADLAEFEQLVSEHLGVTL